MPTLYLPDLFGPTDLAEAIDAGFVREQTHPTWGYRILNYTEKAQYEGFWSPVTLTCRGLIVDNNGRIIARPFTKFFNYGDPLAGELDLTAAAVVLDKLDGCFPRGTTLNLWGGGTITIEEVVNNRLPVTLVGMDDQGGLVPATVTDWHNNGRKDHWLDIEVDCRVSRMSGAAGHANRLRVTVNHHIMVNGEYRPACEIKPGDMVITQTWRPSDEVLRMVRASLLGDGCLLASTTKPGQAKYQEPHSEKQTEYIESLRKTLGDCGAHRSDTRSGYGSRMVWAGSREYEALGDMRREWYPDGVKRVPADLSWMDDYAVAKWLMDDGYRQGFKAQADRISFATNSFPEEDVRRLGERLREMYGISYHLVQDRGWNLVINSGRRQEIQAMWQAIAPHIHPSMRYKLPEHHRDVPYAEPTPGHEIVAPKEVRVISVSPVEPTKRNFPSGRTGYDITTTTHNYMARGVLVHNSLGILYPTPDGYEIATRGSFTSDQALHATRLFRERYGAFTPPDGMTCLFEVIYPENRIVCDYCGADDLFLLGAVNIATGEVVDPHWVSGWYGPQATTFAVRTLADALAMPPRPQAEGLVVRLLETGQMVKIKQDDYVALHKVITGLNARGVWELLGAGKTVADICEPLPDEFHQWVKDLTADLTGRAAAILTEAETTHGEILASLPAGWTRKDYALAAAQHACRPWLFNLLDGRDPRPGIWKTIRPHGDSRPFAYSEDTA